MLAIIVSNAQGNINIRALAIYVVGIERLKNEGFSNNAPEIKDKEKDAPEAEEKDAPKSKAEEKEEKSPKANENSKFKKYFKDKDKNKEQNKKKQDKQKEKNDSTTAIGNMLI